MSMSNLYLASRLALAAAQGNPILFLDGDLVTGIDWLGKKTQWNETVLARPETGNLIPGRIGHRVVIGHWAETVDYAGKLRSVESFFGTEMVNADRIDLLSGWGVAYVFFGPEEQGLGDFDPTNVDYLVPVYRNDVCAIYRVAMRDDQ